MAHNRYTNVISVSTLIGDPVYNSSGEKLGSIEEIVLDLSSGRVAYAVLSFGGILGIGDKLFAIPYNSLHVDLENRQVIFDVAKETLERAPGFDKNNWPDFANREWETQVHGFYGQRPYWEATEVDVERRHVSER